MGPATDKHQAPTHRLKLYVRAVIESEACMKYQIILTSYLTEIKNHHVTIINVKKSINEKVILWFVKISFQILNQNL